METQWSLWAIFPVQTDLWTSGFKPDIGTGDGWEHRYHFEQISNTETRD